MTLQPSSLHRAPLWHRHNAEMEAQQVRHSLPHHNKWYANVGQMAQPWLGTMKSVMLGDVIAEVACTHWNSIEGSLQYIEGSLQYNPWLILQNQVAGSMKLCLPQHILQPQYTSQDNETIGLKSFAEHATNKHDNEVSNGIYLYCIWFLCKYTIYIYNI